MVLIPHSGWGAFAAGSVEKESVEVGGAKRAE